MQSLASEDVIVLRSNALNPELSDKSKGTQLIITPGRSFSMVGNNSYLGYKNIDLNGVSEIEISAQAATRVGATGGVFEIRLDSPTGTLLGTSEKIEPREMRMGPPPAAPAGTPAAGTPAAPPARPNMNSKLKVAIPANSGQHDVYLVFKNSTAKDTQIIMSLSGNIEFKTSE
jgi:cytochrome c